MIYTGIDLISVDRIKKTIKKNPRFTTRFFSIDEQEIFASKNVEKFKIQSIAGNFAAKEAFSKAVGAGVSGFNLVEVEVLRNANGQPYIKLSPKVAKLFDCENDMISTSISHTDEYATAIVIIEKK